VFGSAAGLFHLLERGRDPNLNLVANAEGAASSPFVQAGCSLSAHKIVMGLRQLDKNRGRGDNGFGKLFWQYRLLVFIHEWVVQQETGEIISGRGLSRPAMLN
jgi:hypothetical protein